MSEMSNLAQSGFQVAAVAPLAWGETLSGRPVLDCNIRGPVPVLVRRWQDIAPDIDQAALDQHYLSVHLGGPKSLARRGEGQSRSRDIRAGAHSVVPAGAAFRWETRGPIDFMHLYFDPQAVDHVIASAFDRDPRQVELQDTLGTSDPMVRVLSAALLEELATDSPQAAYADDLIHLLLCRALRLHSNARDSRALAPHILPPYRLRRALDFIEANLAEPVGVFEIAAASGVSRYHFSRAFRQTTGRSPYAYLLMRRVAAAKEMLLHGDLPAAAVAASCGFATASQFSRMFKREVGVTPAGFRRAR